MTNTTASMAGGDRSARIAVALAWAGLSLALACGAGELLAGLGYRWGWWHFRSGIQILRWSATTDLAAAASGSRVDVRSLSRVGKSDFGVNAKRIRKFIKQLAAG